MKKNLIRALTDFLNNATLEQFQEIFSPNIGEHLFKRYTESGPMSLLSSLDSGNEALLVNFLEGKDRSGFKPILTHEDVETVHIRAWQWFDKVNGNTYCSAKVTVNGQSKTPMTIQIPFQYGYGNYYRQKSLEILRDIFSCTVDDTRRWKITESVSDSKKRDMWGGLKSHNAVYPCSITCYGEAPAGAEDMDVSIINEIPS